MKEFFTALMTKFSALVGGVHNAFYTDIGGRLFNTEAPPGTVMPYVIMKQISGLPRYTFTEELTEIVLQFSIFSSNPSSTEVLNIMADLKSLFDDCVSLSITGQTVTKFLRDIEGLDREDVQTVDGIKRCWHYHVDYHIELNKT